MRPPAVLISTSKIDWQNLDRFLASYDIFDTLAPKDAAPMSDAKALSVCLKDGFGRLANESYFVTLIVYSEDTEPIVDMQYFGIKFSEQPRSGLYLCAGSLNGFIQYIESNGLKGCPLPSRRVSLAMYLVLEPIAKGLFKVSPSKNGYLEE